MTAGQGAPDPALDGLTLSMPDIAELAGVQRAVVSMWRKRYATGTLPFPEPVDPDERSPRFRAAEVADWIEERGQGKNPDFRADSAIAAALHDGGDPARGLDALTALLALAPHAPAPLAELEPDDLVDLADEVDPADGFVYREVAGLGDRLPAAARHATSVATAAYNPASAVERLLAFRHRTGDPRLTGSVLRAPALNLVAEIFTALVPDDEELAVTDPRPGCGDLLTAVLGRTERVEPVVAYVPASGSDTLRLARRRLAAHAWPARTVADDVDAHLVTQVPALDEPDLDPVEVLRRVDDAVLGLPLGRVAVVVGPASALVDELRDPEAEAIRDDLLRSGRLRSVLLLPAGLVVARPRQKMALWVLGTVLPGASFGKKYLVVADLSEHAPGGDDFDLGVVQDLLTDILAAQGSDRDAGGHHFRFARFIDSGSVVARRQSLLGAARASADLVFRDPAGVEQHLHELMAHLTEPVPTTAFPTVRGVSSKPSGGRSTIEGLLGRGALHRKSGTRLDAGDVGHRPVEGSLPVIGAPEILGSTAWGSRRIDRIGFFSRYSSGRVTEPGDIVYVASPRPAAVVDVEGFSVVETPARVFRVPDRALGNVVPEVVAADINAAGPDARDPGAWTVRLVPPDQGAVLAQALAELGAERRSLLDRLGLLADLREGLMDGVAAGVVGMSVETTVADGDVSEPRDDVRGRSEGKA